MSRKLKKRLIRIAVSAVLFGIAALLPLNGIWRLGAFLAVYALIGWDILWKAVCGLIHGQALDENFLMALATVGAFATGEYPEGVLVMLLYQVGEWFQSYAVGKSRKSISALMDIRPDYANLDELKAHYQRGGLGDVKVKKFLNNVLQDVLEPIRERRHYWEQRIPEVYEILRAGRIS